MATKQDRIKVLELSIEEQRRDHDFLSSSYHETSVKNITFITAAFVLLIYLYGGSSTNPQTSKPLTLQEKLFIPNEPYGVIIYFLGLLLYFFAIALLLYALTPRTWSTAYDDEQDDGVATDYEKYLIYMKGRYLRSSRINCSSYKKRQSLLQMSFIPLLLGGTILVLLKTFGG